MARTFRTKRQTHPIAELNVTNLIDLGFMLLIIFMLTTSASKQEQTIPVNLPIESRSPQKKSDANKYVVVTVKADGSFSVGTDPAPLSVRQLRARLQDYAANAKKTVVRIRGDDASHFGKMIQLMDELKKADLTQITFDTQNEN
jgi:biopolymer transport protein TolR